MCSSNEKNSLQYVVKVLDNRAPLNLAEPWDNVGLLVEPPGLKTISSIFFTNDLTEKVADEAFEHSVDMIYSYHPPIFQPLKSLRMSNWKDRIIMKCIQKNIAIYSPHTAMDAVNGGVNDWLINCFELENIRPLKSNTENNEIYSVEISPLNWNKKVVSNMKDIIVVKESSGDSGIVKLEVIKENLSTLYAMLLSNKVEIIKCEKILQPISGLGRMGLFRRPMSIKQVIDVLCDYLRLKSIRVSYGENHTSSTAIMSVAVCAGSGGSVLKGIKTDLYITGEMSHHELLDAAHQNITVILCEHSNSERGFLETLIISLKNDLKDVKYLILSRNDQDPATIYNINK